MSQYSWRVKKTVAFLEYLKRAYELDPCDELEEAIRLLEEMDERIDLMEEGRDEAY